MILGGLIAKECIGYDKEMLGFMWWRTLVYPNLNVLQELPNIEPSLMPSNPTP